MNKMIFAFLLIGQLALANGNTTVGPAHSTVAQTYTTISRFSQPLTGTEPCVGPDPAYPEFSRYSETWPGVRAYEQAAAESFNACKNDFNSDCQVVSASYRDVISTEFIGYKACEARVVVHGYKLR